MALAESGPAAGSEKKPLAGRRILVTRARSQGETFARAIENLGGEAVEFPTIEIAPAQDYERLDAAIRNIGAYQWVVFTSANGVEHFWARAEKLDCDARHLAGIRIAAIGPKTAAALAAVGLKAGLVPREYRAEAILRELKPHDVRGKRILLPRAARARDVLPETLRDWGATVDQVVAYRTVAADGDAGELRRYLTEGAIDMVTFTSSSTVTHLGALFPDSDAAKLLAGVAVACIGPITAKTASEMGIRVDLVAREYTIEGLVKAIAEYFSREPRVDG